MFHFCVRLQKAAQHEPQAWRAGKSIFLKLIPCKNFNFLPASSSFCCTYMSRTSRSNVTLGCRLHRRRKSFPFVPAHNEILPAPRSETNEMQFSGVCERQRKLFRPHSVEMRVKSRRESFPPNRLKCIPRVCAAGVIVVAKCSCVGTQTPMIAFVRVRESIFSIFSAPIFLSTTKLFSIFPLPPKLS